MQRMSRTAVSTARRIALTYAVCAMVWIYATDGALSLVFSNHETLATARLFKGWGFVVFTALLLYWLLRREFKARARLATDEHTARTEAEATQQRLVNMLERISDGFVALDDAWRYTYVNEKAAQMLCRRREDLLGKHAWTEFPEGIGQPVYHACHKARAEQMPALVEEYSPSLERWYENRIYPAADGLSIFFQDITARKQAEVTLHESEKFQRRLFESSPIGLFLCRLDGTPVDVNPAFASIIGRDVAACMQLHYWDITPVEYADRDQQQLESLRRTGRYGPYEKEYLHKDGHRVPVRLSGLLLDKGGETLIWSCVDDISERQRLDASLRESDASLQLRLVMLNALYEGAHALAHSLDVQQVSEIVTRTCVQTFGARLAWVGSAEPDGRVQRLAHYPVAVDYLRDAQVRWDISPQGYGPTGQAIRAGVVVVVPAIDADPAFQPWRDAAHAQGFCASAAFPLLSRERAIGALNLYSDQPGFFTAERVEYFQAFAQLAGAALENAQLFQKVRQHSGELEQHVAERTAQLSEANAALEAFAYSIAHDLRAPLRALQGFSQALIEDYAPQLDATARDYVLRIDRAARRMDELMRDILDYCRLDRAAISIRPLALEETVNEALRLQEEALRSSAADVSVQRPLPVVLGHYATLVQALSNLLSNAIKFVAPGVRPVLRFTIEQRPGWVRLWLADNGLGIAAEHQDRIFKIFERLHGVENYPGTGIGLAIVQKALTRMGGRVGVESSPDEGSRFWIELPIPEVE
jgi:PAS domain S-box-containing protein